MSGLNNLMIGRKYHSRMNIEVDDVTQTGLRNGMLSVDCICLRLKADTNVTPIAKASLSGKSVTTVGYIFKGAGGASASKDPRVNVKSPTSRIFVEINPEIYRLAPVQFCKILEPESNDAVELVVFSSDESIVDSILNMSHVFRLYLID